MEAWRKPFSCRDDDDDDDDDNELSNGPEHSEATSSKFFCPVTHLQQMLA